MRIKATPSPPNPKPSPETSRRRGRPPSFPVGFEVEVRSSEEGFIGSWFEATVTGSLPKFHRYSVTYTTLLSDDEDSPAAPLKDSVRYGMVRPRPPRPDPTRMVYGLYHLVDAYHNDGWWAGVVSGLPGGGKDLYKVQFPTSREEFEFRPSELREQMNFVGGNWVSLQGQDVKGGNGMFDVGTRVEISRDSEYYGTSWFVGTILKTIGKYFLVEYENIRVGGGDTGAILREIVDLQYIRLPPEMESKKFDVLDEVEAFHGDRWFAATISAILPGPRYIVNFKGQEGMELGDTSVRSRRRWNGRRWVSISQVKHSKSPTARATKSACQLLKSSKSSSIEDNDEVVDGSDFVMSKRKGADGASPERQIESPNAVKKPKKVKVSQQNCPLADGMARKCNSENETNETMAMKSSYSADLISECIPALTDGQLLPESPCERIVVIHGEGKSRENENPCEKSSVYSKGKVSKHQFNPTCLSPSSHGREVSDSIPIADWQICEGVRSPSTRQRRKKLVIRRKTNIDVDVREHAEEETRQRKGDKIQQTRIINIPDSPEGPEIRGLEVMDIIAREGRENEDGTCNQSILIDLPPNHMQPYRQEEVMQCISPCVQPSSHHHEATGNMNSLIANSEGNSQSSSSTFFTNMQENFSDDGYLTPEMESIRIGNPRHSTTQLLPCSLTTFFNEAREMQSRNVELNGIKTKEQISPSQDCILHGGNELVPSMLTSEKIDPCSNQLSSDKIALPFTKKSPLWEMLESDRALHIAPQHPHFCPLEQHLMEFREGMAIGLMIAFIDLVAGIRRLGATVPPQKFEDKLKALDSLESNGFDVHFLRSHVTRLLEITSRLRQSENERIELKAKLSEKAAEKETKKVEHSVLDNVIAHLLESRALVVSEMESIDSEICKMERAVKAAEEAFVSATVQFDSSSVAPWGGSPI